MPRNITIKEVGVAQNISGVTHIVVPDIESSSLDYVPEEDLIRRFKVINSNGTYNPSDDLGAGYVALLVDVPVKSVKGKDKNTGKITTVSVNPETGEIEKTEQGAEPAGIHVVIPPTKRKYVDGDTIDFTGIHVYLVDENNHPWISDTYPTGEIPFEELTFPVTIAEGESHEGDGTHYTNGAGLHCALYVFSESMNGKYGYFYYSPSVLGTIVDWNGWDDGEINAAIKQTNSNQGASAYLTIYENEGNRILYGYPIDKCAGANLAIVQLSSAMNGYQGTFTSERWKNFGSSSDPEDQDEYSRVPVSTVDPTTISDMSNMQKDYSDKQEIPVQWSKDGGAVLEDTFEINVS